MLTYGIGCNTAKEHYEAGRLTQAATQLEKFKAQIDRGEFKGVSQDTKNRLKASADYFLRTWSKYTTDCIFFSEDYQYGRYDNDLPYSLFF